MAASASKLTGMRWQVELRPMLPAPRAKEPPAPAANPRRYPIQANSLNLRKRVPALPDGVGQLQAGEEAVELSLRFDRVRNVDWVSRPPGDARVSAGGSPKRGRAGPFGRCRAPGSPPPATSSRRGSQEAPGSHEGSAKETPGSADDFGFPLRAGQARDRSSVPSNKPLSAGQRGLAEQGW
jgi:hypothetical protein